MKKLQEAEEKFAIEHPEWDNGKLREIDPEIEQRMIHGKSRYYFSELDITDDKGSVIPFEPEAMKEVGFDRIGLLNKTYVKVSSIQAIIIFCVYRLKLTQEDTACYLDVSQQYVAKQFKAAIECLKKDGNND